MGQQPNIELEVSDLPRPTGHPAPPRRWSPSRPGELETPSDVPWGGAYGTTGPDTGYALRLIRQRTLHVVAGEHHHNAEAAVAAIAAARASHFGRAPILDDIDVAAILLGYDRNGADPDRTERIEAVRPSWVANLSHDAGRSRELVAAVPVEVLAMTPDTVRTAVGAGNWLFQR